MSRELVKEVGNASLHTVTVTPQACHGLLTEAQIIMPGEYLTLSVDGNFSMSNVGILQMGNTECYQRAHGNVLLVGLGIGLLLGAIIKKPQVERVDMVELEQSVIDLVAPDYLAEPEGDKIHMHCHDIYTWQPPEGILYDTIFFDIWTVRTTENIAVHQELHDLYQPYVNSQNPNAWVNSFYHEELKSLRRTAVMLRTELDRIIQYCDSTGTP